LADNHVNFCLVPEVPFKLESLFAALKERLENNNHAVLVVAEGAGQEHFESLGEKDASGNVKYGDIGLFLRDAIKDHFKSTDTEISLKYIDPSYIIRSQRANPHDSAFCLLLGHCAVHAGMAGLTEMIIGYWNHQFTHVQTQFAVSTRKQIDPESWIWNAVLASTGQPMDMN
jgi:6-phosphofructokinase 1